MGWSNLGQLVLLVPSCVLCSTPRESGEPSTQPPGLTIDQLPTARCPLPAAHYPVLLAPSRLSWRSRPLIRRSNSLPLGARRGTFLRPPANPRQGLRAARPTSRRDICLAVPVRAAGSGQPPWPPAPMEDHGVGLVSASSLLSGSRSTRLAETPLATSPLGLPGHESMRTCSR